MARMNVEEFLAARLKDRKTILKASEAIDAFRKKYGRAPATFNSVRLLRKLRDARR